MLTTYAGTKYLAALYMGYMAKHTNKAQDGSRIHFTTVSPGSTSGTDLMNKPELSCLLKMFAKYIAKPLLLRLGKAHTVTEGAQRYVTVLLLDNNENNNNNYKNGGFYASQKGLTGPLGDQGTLFDKKTYQANAYKAIHSFLK